VRSACDGNSALHVRFEYPATQKQQYDRFVSHVSGSLRHVGQDGCWRDLGAAHMATFVHITPSRNAASVRRAGIRCPTGALGVYALPVIRNFVASHQWVRELKRGRAPSMHGVYFRLADTEPVLFGRFDEALVQVTAAEAVARFMSAANQPGIEVIVPRKILPAEIRRIQPLSHRLGWRYSPEARGRPFCGCIQCNPPGGINSRRKWRAWEDRQQ
jgi:hypothetical protein